MGKQVKTTFKSKNDISIDRHLSPVCLLESNFILKVVFLKNRFLESELFSYI
jgi:hypothetical protein